MEYAPILILAQKDIANTNGTDDTDSTDSTDGLFNMNDHELTMNLS